MLEQKVIEQCAPTLAGMKIASIFHYTFPSVQDMYDEVACLNQKLNPCDVWLRIMSVQGTRAFIYVYRRQKLFSYLAEKQVADFLADCGYTTASAEDCLEEFQRRFSSEGDFPHEMGIFLGFPLEDVIGFIENKGADCKYIGFWKVYGDVSAAQRIFYKFQKCTRIYRQLYLEGRSILKLTIAA